MLTNQTLAENLRKRAERVFLILRQFSAFGIVWSIFDVADELVSIRENGAVNRYAHEVGV